MADAQEHGIEALTRLRGRLHRAPDGERSESDHQGSQTSPARAENRYSVWLPREDDVPPGESSVDGLEDESPGSGGPEGEADSSAASNDESYEYTESVPHATPWMVIAEQALQGPSEQAGGERVDPRALGASPDPVAPDTNGARSEASPTQAERPERSGANQWLPTDIRREEASAATDAWPPDEDAEIPSQPGAALTSRSPWLLPEPEAKAVPKTSWVPAELASESELESFATEEPTVATPVPELAPEPAPAAAPEAAPTTEGEFPSVADLEEPADYGRRTKAVRAYCRELFPVSAAPVVAEQILESLSPGISQETVVLRLTRKAAARRLANRTVAGHIGGEPCAATPARLAARANGTLTGRERDQLERHLRSCLVCRAMEVRAVRADRAFAAIIGPTLLPD